MLKKCIGRGLLGLPLGIAIGYCIAIVISACIGDGQFHPVAKELIDTTGSELAAVVLQTVLSGLMGAGYAAASVIWEIDSWSLARQSGVYFAVACVLMFPIAYIANWMEHSLAGFLSYAAIFVGIFVCVWLSQYFVWKSRVRSMNEQLQDKVRRM